ncbi:carbohydrate ABC transporter membrane protein 2, CUT1 family (TC 3.A.1.1.-) [Anaerobranca californiensis DSM 14826]|jgi:arabinogalactan oligomer/maltooligosaccharide transport system permease protein|uniref:Carbohydrate ABC transporter membrane protein 2, CUT1 family (TC 3.A.1.1.-) n=1 Tax=Anaerobranca californiensis DSM 14826 TaxID=1120989 RepID=A0A1M6REL6_9FIRM|nr:sugar ABC transporter permease [Anaerobranca californiensis]SHK30925.1 carbohydrate ABC transporter membrane protein 2, CUT1 family (TC 3.A.1.1.-) [Anaerobranca californiensis DSM 14826]
MNVEKNFCQHPKKLAGIFKNFRLDWGLVITYLVLIIMIVIVFYPITWIVSSSFNPGRSLSGSQLLPRNPTLDHYRVLFNETDYLLWYKNTLKIAIINSALSVVLTTMTAYAFSRFRFWGRKMAMMTFLIIQMFPGAMGMIAIYVLLLRLNLLDTHLGLILVYAGGQIPFNTWIMKGYLDTIPKSIEEAAYIDGAGHLTVFYRIMLPLALPIISVVALFNFFGPMFDYILPRIILRSPSNYTLALGLHQFVSQQFANNFTRFAAGAVLVAFPIAVVYLLLQKLLISGLTKGAVK